MDDGKADILAGISRLRAKAAEQLSGNDFYMIVQQLDSLATSAELSDESARSVFNLISARLEGGATAMGAAGEPEVPDTPDTPAQPDAPSTPEEPVSPPSPAQPDTSPGPEIPSPPSSPAEPQSPQEIPTTGISADAAVEQPQVIQPRASSFGMSQATVAVRFPEPSASPKPAEGLGAAVMAARTLVEERLSGNSYYTAANLLGQLQILPPVSGGGEVTRPEGFEGALALLRREAEHLTGVAHSEAARVIAALEGVLMPKAEPVTQQPAEAPAEAAAPAEAVETAAEAELEAEPEPRSGFDDLAEAAWRRVQQVSAAESKPAAMLNGATAPAPAVEAKAPNPAPAAAAPAEMMAKDIGEAFNDGGSESRSSEPCYLHEFEPAGAQPGTSGGEEPAAEAGSDAASETQCEAAVPSEAPAAPLSEMAAAEMPEAEPEAAAEAQPQDAELDAVAAEAEPQDVEPETVAAEAEPQDAELETVEAEAEPQDAELEAVAAKTEPETELEIAAGAEPDGVAPEVSVTAAAGAEPDTAKAEPGEAEAGHSEEPAERSAPRNPARRGLFGRLFGGASA